MKLPFPERILLPHQFYYPLLDIHDRVREPHLAQYRRALERMPDPDSIAGLVYLHVPFCDYHCSFCPFDTTGPCERLSFTAYVDAIKREVDAYADSAAVSQMRKTGLYIGGGTPTRLPVEHFANVVHYVCERLAIDGPVTTELAAETIDDAKLMAMSALGIDRVSFGIQTFHESVRTSLGIGTSLDGVREAFGQLREHGFAVFVDLMYGLPHLGLPETHEDVRMALAMRPDGIDYMQFYPYGAPLQAQVVSGSVTLPSNLECLGMLQQAAELFDACGYSQVSRYTFSLQGMHNVIDHSYYGEPEGPCEPSACLGLGPSAIGWFNGITYRNHWYDEYVASREASARLLHLTSLTEEQRRRRTLALFPSRLSIRRECLDARVKPADERAIDALTAAGYLCEHDGWLSLTQLGRLYIDNITFEFLDEDSKKRLAPKIWRGGEEGQR